MFYTVISSCQFDFFPENKTCMLQAASKLIKFHFNYTVFLGFTKQKFLLFLRIGINCKPQSQKLLFKTIFVLK